jgi:hypothetical protein
MVYLLMSVMNLPGRKIRVTSCEAPRMIYSSIIDMYRPGKREFDLAVEDIFLLASEQ